MFARGPFLGIWPEGQKRDRPLNVKGRDWGVRVAVGVGWSAARLTITVAIESRSSLAHMAVSSFSRNTLNTER